MADYKSQLQALEQRIKELELENKYLAQESEQVLHSRVIAEKLDLCVSEEDLTSTFIESLVSYNSLYYGALYRLSADGSSLEVGSYYALDSELVPSCRSVVYQEHIRAGLQKREGYFDATKGEGDWSDFIPPQETFYDIYVLPIYLESELYGLVFIANTDADATEFRNHLGSVQLPTVHFEQQLEQIKGTHKLEREVKKRTQELEHDIRLRKQIERNLEENELRLSDLLACSSDFIWESDLEGSYLYVSDSAKQMLGFFPSEIIGRRFFELAPDLVRQKYRVQFERLASKARPIKDLVVQFVNKTGDKIWLEVNAIPFFDDSGAAVGYRGVNKDVTGRIESDARLLESQQKLALHIEQTPLGVIEWDLNFCVAEWNPAAEHIFGYTRDEALFKHPTELILPESIRPIVDDVWAALLEKKGGERSVNDNLTRDGRNIKCDWYNTPLVNTDGEVVGVASLVQDITERIEQEEELIIAKNEANRANLAKSEFLANMSHELRTPLHGILSFAQFGSQRLGSVPEDRIRNYFSNITASGKRLQVLLDDLLDISKLEAGKMQLDFSSVSIANIVQECIEEQRAIATGKSVSVDVDVVGDLSDVVCDSARIGQVIFNLLGNAIKYSDEGGSIRIELESGHFSAPNSLKGEVLQVQVIDDGRGVPENELDNIFEKFSQSSRTTVKDGGTGLGLAITREIIALHSGRVWAQNNATGGACFTFQIPLAQSIEEEQ